MKRIFDFLEHCVSMMVVVLIIPMGWIGLLMLALVIWVIKNA